MSEQQRIFLAVALCLGILISWQFLVVGDAPPPKQRDATAENLKPAAERPTAVDRPPAKTEDAVARPAVEESTASVATEETPESRRSFQTLLFSGELSNKAAALTAFDLTRYDERSKEKEAEPGPVSFVNAENAGRVEQARIEWKLGSREGPPLAWQESEEGLSLEGVSAEGVKTTVRVLPREDLYALDYTLSAANGTSQALPVSAKVTLSLGSPADEEEGSFFAPRMNIMTGFCALHDGIEREVSNDLEEDGAWTAPSPAVWAGIDRQYFVVAMVPAVEFQGGCELSAKEGRLAVEFDFQETVVEPGTNWTRTFTLYLGPKRTESLTRVDARLADAVDYSIWGIPLGFMARPMVFLLNTFHGWTSSWGVAIMLLTLLVKLLLFPVTYKSIVSMRKMTLLRPELDKLKKKFEGDRERQQMEQMKLFKEKGVNPLGGCLPMLMQMPVWLALYRTLWTAVDLYQQPFLWLQDLTAKEPGIPILALVLGVFTFLQQRLTPTSVDSQQQKMMLYFMPAFLTFIMISLPSGLVLYILVNSILTIVQQLVINKRTVNL